MNFPFVNKAGVHYDIETEQYLYKGTEQSYWVARVYRDGAEVYKTANHSVSADADGSIQAESEAHTEGLKWAHHQK